MRKRSRFLVLAGIATALFCGLAIAMQTNHLAGLDSAIRMGAHGLASPLLTQLAQQMSWFGDLAVLGLFGAVAVAVLLRRRHRDAALFLVLTMLGALALENGLKFSFQRVRPPAFFGPEPWTYSFPSGHALFSACFYGAIAIVTSRAMQSTARKAVVWIVTVALVLMIGGARIYLGVHYPSDVMGGYLVAIAWIAMLLSACLRKLS
ncbi:MAG: phosphatase PAP2 family protein [Hyphomicrobiales bacterium]|nr:phosphatase PAP2 family protein [Hyphomicrobiales bacterium]MDE2116046.1 phosphatase PAP2 family protein [Hyphomicrobiales bacterium]